ncbi:MAG TPA: hypothetical protein GXZ87_09670 [Bacteroidales bacterium]|nr:hypothetical protein [Bacteroidales bacterium]
MSKERIRISVQELIDLMVENRTITKKTADEFIRVLLSTIEDALINGEPVKVKGLGTFKSQWNEPRRSVDVNTGEEIIIEGYYRAVFIPETSLRDTINEPFAHLEPVVIESPEEKTEEVLQDVVDEIDESRSIDKDEPLRVFEEQAEEIKELLSEINSISSQKPIEPVIEKKEEKPLVLEPEEIEKVLRDMEEVDADDMDEATQVEDDDILDDDDIFIEDEEPIVIPEQKPKHVKVVDSFDVVRDLSLLRSGDDEQLEKEKIEYSDEEVIKTDIDGELDSEFVEEDELIVAEPVTEPISDTEIGLSEEKGSDEKSEEENVEFDNEEVVEIDDKDKSASELVEEGSDAEKEEQTVEEPIFIPGFDTGLGSSEEREETTSVEKIDDKPKLTKADKKDEKSKVPKILIYLLILFALVAIAWFVINLRKYSEFKNSQKKIENLMDSTAEALRVKEIADMLARQDSAFVTLDSLELDNDSINFTNDPKTSGADTAKPIKKIEEKKVEKKEEKKVEKKEEKKTNTVVVSSDNVFNAKRSYNEILATERMVAGSRLTTFAKKYYGNAVFWVYIYEANKSKIANPNKVSIGIEVKIPKLDPKLIDTGNPECINYAKKLQTKYLAQ